MATLFWTDEDSGKLVVFQFDATTSEDPTDAVTITDHPVEQGANIVDHARDEPERITLEGIVTNTPHQGNLTDEDDFEVSALALSFETVKAPGTQTLHLDIPDPPIALSPSGLISAGISALGSALFGGPNNDATAWSNTEKARGSLQASALQPASKVNRARVAYEKLLGAKEKRALVTVQTSVREYFDMLVERVSAPRSADDGDGLKFSIDLRRLKIAASETVQSPQPTESRGSTGRSLGSQSTKEDANGDAKTESILHSGLFGN